MDVLNLAHLLGLPEMTLCALEKTPLPDDAPQLHNLFWQDYAAFERAAQALDEMTILRLFLTWIPDMRERYDAQGIPESIFPDNLRDIALWCLDHEERFGQPGFQQWKWVAHSLRMELFRLGRLQFEPITLPCAAELNGTVHPAGTPALSVHIPAGEPLETAEVLSSFDKARTFFPQYTGRTYPLLYCHSWLLSPQLKELLPQNARILRFQDLFHVFAQAEDRQAEERVFGHLMDTPAGYPENTALQRALKACLMQGSRCTAGEGIRAL